MIIDAHTHIFPDFFIQERDTLIREDINFSKLYSDPKSIIINDTELIEAMKREEIEKSVCLGFPWYDIELCRRHNDFLMEAAIKNPKEIIAYCCIYPGQKGFEKEVERCLDAGAKGIGEIALYDKDLNSDTIAMLDSLAVIAREFKVPLLLHINEPVGHLYPGKVRIDLAALYIYLKRHPMTTFILAHWGGGLFFYNLLKKEVDSVLKNVYYDTAASPFLYKKEVYKLAIQLSGTKKILFGSDYPLISPSRYFRELNELGISDEDKQDILRNSFIAMENNLKFT